MKPGGWICGIRFSAPNPSHAAMLAMLLGCAAAASPGGPPGNQPPVRLDQIQAIREAETTVKAEPRPMHDLVSSAVRQTREQFHIPSAERRRLTVAAWRDLAPLDLLQAVESLTGMQWWEMDLSHWMLAEDQRHARLLYTAPPTGKPGADTAPDYGRLSAALDYEFLRSITPDQWNRMAGGEVLGFGELSPRQQQVLLASLHAATFEDWRGPSGPTREARQGTVVVYLCESFGGPIGYPALALSYPSRTMPGYRPFGKKRDELHSTSGRYITPNPDGTYSPINPHRKLYAPGRAPLSPADVPTEKDLQDPRLNRLLQPGSGPLSWEKLVDEMQRLSETGILLEGAFLKKAPDFLQGRLRVIDIMEKLAERTDRRWHRIGNLRFLAPIRDEKRDRNRPDAGTARPGSTSGCME